MAVELQVAWDGGDVPSPASFKQWVTAALDGRRSRAEVSVRVVGEREGKALNERYRGKARATNVLAFPAEFPQGVDAPLLGDLVICGPLVEREARAQATPVHAHWAHLAVHGTLHLIGFDHQNDADASRMEALEEQILAKLGFPSPYAKAR